MPSRLTDVNPIVLFLAVAAAFTPGRVVRPQAQPASATLRVAVVGQALIHADLRTGSGAAIEQARRYLAGADVRFTNLEAVVASADAKVTPRSASAERTDPAVLDCLKEMGFNMLSLSNNHAMDLGASGIRTTIDEVRKRGFAFAGTGADSDEAGAPGFLDTQAGTVALVGIASGASQLTPGTWAGPGQPGVNYLEIRKDGTMNPDHAKRILGAVREAARRAAYVIVYYHNHVWGEPTGSGQPPGREKRAGRFDTPPWVVAWSHQLIDAGASMYVGHGDPALHGVEIYNGRPILYGLGNYIFNSVNPLDVYGPLAYMSAVVRAEFRGGNVTSLRFRPVVLSLDSASGTPRGVPYLAETGEAAAILGRLADVSREHGTQLRIAGDSAEVVLK